MAKSRREEEIPHGPLHAVLIAAVITTLYPILWVVTIAFSGKQNLAIVDVPPDPSVWDRLRAVMPWPAEWSFSNFTSVMTDQPFARWLLNSVIVAVLTTIGGIGGACLSIGRCRLAAQDGLVTASTP